MTGSQSWDEETDLLVCGAGAAGMTAALVAAHHGLSVLVCEKLSQVGGTTATSGGMVFAPGNPQSGRAGVADSLPDARRYLDAELGPDSASELMAAFLESSPVALAFLEQHTDVKFDVPRPNPDYHDLPGASRAGRTVLPAAFDGRLLGNDFDLVRPPREELMILGGMMVARREVAILLRPYASLQALAFTARQIGRYLIDRIGHRRGTRLLLGNALIARLLYSLRRKSVPVRVNTRLKELVSAGGRIVGAVVEQDGKTRRIGARRGVVLATGGFAGSESWKSTLAQEFPAHRSLAFEDSCGEGFDAAVLVGARVDASHVSPYFWAPVSVLKKRDGGETVWMHGVLDRAKPGLIAVNAAGRRFVNEAVSYHDFVTGMFNDRDAGGQPTQTAHLICDDEFIRRYGLGLVQPMPTLVAYALRQDMDSFLKAGYLKKADSLRELAAAIGVDAGNLEAAVAAHNADSEEGLDKAFGKGSTALNRHNGDPANQPNPCLKPITRAPFYSVAVHAGILGTSAGLRTDKDGQVLDGDGRALDGLYACGNDMASVMRGRYPGPGITLGPALVFGYRVAMRAAARP
jgi:succinate dehydrogenase/fumarate reductase flavoprotein subunit